MIALASSTVQNIPEHFRRPAKDDTSHAALEYLPEVVLISREHPLQGLPLPVIRLARRHGGLELLLQTPDGSRRFVPLEWTDADTKDPACQRGSVSCR